LIDQALADIEPAERQEGEFTAADLYEASDKSRQRSTYKSRADKMVQEGKWEVRKAGKFLFYRRK